MSNKQDKIKEQTEFNEKADNQSTQPDNKERLKAEQQINEFPEHAEVKRGYAKWTDNNGNFHKYPIDGTTAVREPAHEQHDLTLENRDYLDQTSAHKTPRNDNDKAYQAMQELHRRNIMNDFVHEELADAQKAKAPQPPKTELEGVEVEGDGNFRSAEDAEQAHQDAGEKK